MTRLPYLMRDEVPDEYEELFEVDEENPDDVVLNIHRMMANNPLIWEAWGEWMWTLYDETGDSRLRELTILAVAREIDSRYVWHQHVRPALAAGASREEILSISEREYDSFDPAERAIVGYAIAFLRDTIDDEIHSELMEYHSNETVVALIFLVSEYFRMSKVIDALGTDLETDFVGWRLQRLN